MVGLSILTKGSIEERLESKISPFSLFSHFFKVFFKSFDGDNDGLITKDEMLFMLQGVYRNLYVTDDQREHKRKSLRSFVDLCFLNLDTDLKGRLNFDEFKRLAVIEPQVQKSDKKEFNFQLFECFAFDPVDESMMATIPAPETKPEAVVVPVVDVAPKLSLADDLFFSTKDLFIESLPPPEWEPDKAVTRCPVCCSLFVFPVKRRHHCR
jgi:hypothetical protein